MFWIRNNTLGLNLNQNPGDLCQNVANKLLQKRMLGFLVYFPFLVFCHTRFFAPTKASQMNLRSCMEHSSTLRSASPSTGR